MRVFATSSSKTNLCDFCRDHIATCPTAEHLKFGDGVGNDNVIECSEFLHNGKGYGQIIGRPELGIFRSRRIEQEKKQ